MVSLSIFSTQHISTCCLPFGEQYEMMMVCIFIHVIQFFTFAKIRIIQIGANFNLKFIQLGFDSEILVLEEVRYFSNYLFPVPLGGENL